MSYTHGPVIRLIVILLIALSWPLASQTAPQTGTPRSRWKDPSDGWFDMSEYLAKASGFFPFAMPVTDPAVGYGLLGGPIFLRPSSQPDGQSHVRPNITAAFGLYTSNGSWGIFGMNSRSWNQGRFETLVGGGHFSVNLKYAGEAPGESGKSRGYNLSIGGGMVRGKMRIARSKFYVGLRYSFVEVHASPSSSSGGNSDDTIQAPYGLGRTDRLAGPALSLIYDARDAVLTTSKGIYSESKYSYYDPSFGGTINFQRMDQTFIDYLPLKSSLILGMRGDLALSFGNPVFYARPYVTLRGAPAMRYQRQNLVQTEWELRWQFWKRFSAVGFAGGAKVWNSQGPSRSDTIASGGGGFRYELARKFKLHYGIDVARGPNDTAIYFIFGSAWARP